jgi:hypothetical protein
VKVEVNIPDQIAKTLPGDMSRRILESIAIEGYRRGELSPKSVVMLIGIDNIAFPNETWKRIIGFSIWENPCIPCPIQNPKLPDQYVHNSNENAIDGKWKDF